VAILYPTYPTATPLTITIAGLASDANLLTGRQSIVIDNTGATAYDDYLISGKITANGVTAPTSGKSIEVWAVGSGDGTAWPDTITGAGDAGKAWTSADIKAANVAFIAAMATSATIGQGYPFRPVSLKAAFGGVLPPKALIFVTHSMGQNTHATGANSFITVQPIAQNIN
jgi:hypothetical protein